MEVAIPIVLLGGMYVISNQDKEENQENMHCNNSNNKKERNREGFQPNSRNLQKVRNMELPNNNPIPENFPVNGVSELKENPNYYPNPNFAMDKYYNPQVHKEELKKNPNNFKSLTGENLPLSDFKHDNMQPFFGGKVKQNIKKEDFFENRLDNMTGTGSQQIRKREQAPLFKPQQNMEFAYGTPNQSDFIQSRMNPSMNMNNVKPFQEIRVGPGLSEKGGVLGTSGYNAGMEAREKWIDKNVDELRTKNNPKISYKGRVLTGKMPVTRRGDIGKVEKNRPDTFYVNGPDRYFTTTGIEKAPTSRAIDLIKQENRPETTVEYFGGGDNAAGPSQTYIPGEYLPDKREQVKEKKDFSGLYAKDKYNPEYENQRIKIHQDCAITNNRDITQKREPQKGILSFSKAVVAPLLDVLRPTRKENVIGNLRTYGNSGTSEYTGTYAYNPADKQKTTIREMTENDPQHYNVNNQDSYGGYGYLSNKYQSVAQQRDTTTTGYTGGTNRDNGGYGYLSNEYQAVTQQRDTTNRQHIGNAGNTSGTTKQQTYDYAYNQNLIDKEPIMRGRKPMGNNVKVYNGQDFINMKVDKLDSDRMNDRINTPYQNNRITPSLDTYGMTRHKSEAGTNIQDRNDPSLLSALDNNPYNLSIYKK